ncbi:hypothetical protein DPX16_17879 [Anabarilius grahami]|uniref:Uncharacterized protein n=1 Tax=Anabarilius grahami TaxID=495550 RepID=A0A3N0YHJ3_ANAGA|nr:hypothetical protein DPX16_17879 [Anabarilius grahami]
MRSCLRLWNALLAGCSCLGSVKKGAALGRLDERFLSGHNPTAPVSLPFLPDLHVEIEKAWKNPYSTDVEGLSQHGYVSMPPVDETFANYLVTGRAPTLKAPVLPYKPLKMTSRLNGREYAAAGQAGAALHTMTLREAKARSAAFKACIPIRSDPGPRQTRGPDPSRFEDRRQGQKSSVASRAPPPPRSRSQRRWYSRKKQQDLREVINNRCQQRQ